MEIKKISQTNKGMKFLVIPKHSKLKVGDYVKIIKIEEEKNIN